jgi:hypothetical protein
MCAPADGAAACDPKADLGQGAPGRTGWVENGRQSLLSAAVLFPLSYGCFRTALSNQDQPQSHEAPRDGIIGFGGGGRNRSTSRIPSSETQAISQNASM